MNHRCEISISERFKGFLSDISPSHAEAEQADARIDKITTRLRKSFYGKTPKVFGSYSKATFVYGSDIDIFAPFEHGEAMCGDRLVNSGTLLKRVRDELRARYPTTPIRRNGQAVSLTFSDGIRRYDVVPAIYARRRQKCAFYWIPDGEGGWMETSPDLQRKHLEEAVRRSGGKLNRVIQLIKWWSRLERAPLKPFHLEVVLAHQELGVGAASYSQLTAAAFQLLAARKASALRNPFGLTNLIPAADTPTKREDLARKLAWAARSASQALAEEEVGNNRAAIQQWNEVFNGTF